MSREPSTPSDAELVASVLAGDREAFGTLYDRHARAVRAVVVAVSGDWSATDDLAQESFLRAYRKLPSLDNPQKFREWITGIARHVARERRRTLHRDRHEFGQRLLTSLSSRDSTSHTADRDQLNQTLHALGELPEQERLAIHAFYFESKNANDAAELLGLSRSGFYAVLKRAVADLATLLGSPLHKEH